MDSKTRASVETWFHRRTYWNFFQDHLICMATSSSMCLSCPYLMSPFLLSYYPFDRFTKLHHVHHHSVVDSSLTYLLYFPLASFMLWIWCHYIFLIILVTFIFCLKKTIIVIPSRQSLKVSTSSCILHHHVRWKLSISQPPLILHMHSFIMVFLMPNFGNL